MKGLLGRYGPWAVVAGASEGIGAAFSHALSQAGFSLILIARRAAPLEALAGELRARYGREVRAVPLDLGAEELEARAQALADEHEVGLIVYNAALSPAGPFLSSPLREKQRVIDVNVRGPLVMAHVFGERMAARRRGGIVLMSSLTAFTGSPWVATYGATKAFNLALGEALAHELKRSGVDVVVACAGATRTPGFVAMVAGRRGPRAMSPEDVAREALAALRHPGACVPGLQNRLAQAILTRLLPRRLAVRIMAAETEKLL